MTKILSGKEVAGALTERTRRRAEELTREGRTPCVTLLRVGARKDDLAYENGLRKRSGQSGVALRVREMPEDVTEEELIGAIREENADAEVTGILLFRPLPGHLQEQRIVNEIDPAKDLDGATDASLLTVFKGSGQGYAPCTPAAVMEILSYYGIDPAGKNVVVIGRSLVVGKPLSLLLQKANATVTMCHTKTRQLSEITTKADILISAAGHIGTLSREHFGKDQIIIDVGINFNAEGRMTGDVVYADALDCAAAVTPVPGGVGAVTTSVLLSRAVR